MLTKVGTNDLRHLLLEFFSDTIIMLMELRVGHKCALNIIAVLSTPRVIVTGLEDCSYIHWFLAVRFH